MPIKRNPHLFLLFFLILPFCSSAQRYSIKDSTHVFALLDAAETMFSAGKNDSAILFAQQATQFAEALNFKKGVAYSLIEKADIHIGEEKLDKAESLAKQSYDLGQQIKDSLIMAIAKMQMAQVKMYGRHYDDAIVLFEKCTNYFNRHPSKYAALAFNDFGFTYGQISNPQKQAAYLIKALEVYDKMKKPDLQELAIVLNNLSALYYNLGDKKRAVDYGEKSIALRKNIGNISKLALGYCNLSQIYLGTDDAKAKQYQLLGVKYAEESKDESMMISAYISSSQLAGNQKKYSESLGYEKKAVSLLEKSGKNPAMLSKRYISLGFSYGQLADSIEAYRYFEKSLLLSTQLKDKSDLRDVYYYLTIFFKQYKNYYDAYENYKKYILYRDSIINENTRVSIAEIETKYQSAKKDNEITRLNAGQRIKELQIEKQNALIAGNKLEAQRKEKEIELLSQAKELQELKIKQQDDQLEKQQLLAKNNTQQLQLAEKEKQLQRRQLKNSNNIRNFMLAGIGLLILLSYFLFNRYQLKRKIREQQALLVIRTNIARELHDEVGSTLTSIKILSEVSEKHLSKDQAKTSAFLQKITEQSAMAQQGISDIVWSVRPENDKMENMVIRMREYIAHTLESKNIHTHIDIDESIPDQTLDMNQRRDFLMIFKEAVNNIAKYACATHVNVRLEKYGQFINLLIADDGKGFDTEKQTSSNGLKNMNARATALNGRISITSELNKGSSVNLYIPTT
ncbi:MAG: tetratricopeptide repeat protein [Bacteroidetes bacterium]|nr:tetratricopeptide repeat protein [Bacteroidota bacterium]